MTKVEVAWVCGVGAVVALELHGIARARRGEGHGERDTWTEWVHSTWRRWPWTRWPILGACVWATTHLAFNWP